MFGFVAGLVVAIVLGMAVSRVRKHESSDPANDGNGPNRMQLRPKGKSNPIRYAFAVDAVASQELLMALQQMTVRLRLVTPGEDNIRP